MAILTHALGLLLCVWVARAADQAHDVTNTVKLGQANVVGTVEGAVEKFLGIPYAQPPLGELRLRLPQLLDSYNGTVDATSFGNQCFQQSSPLPSNIPPEIVLGVLALSPLLSQNGSVPQSEDCLNLNIIRPANVSADAKLPVLFYYVKWIYGGGFSGGSNAMPGYNGTAIVQRSINIGEPVIFVAVNYRLHVFGFLGGREVKEAGIGNLGLQDQRTALRWVQKFIPFFGAILRNWGESAGSSSVFFHLFANNGDPEGLFRGGIMNSGTSTPTGDISDLQHTYDFVVQQVGCSNATDSLACLRTVSADSLLAAANLTGAVTGFKGLAGSPWLPRGDGVFVTQPPEQLAVHGKAANVPFIVGDVRDEGTLFSVGNLNITTEQELVSYLKTFWFPGASSSDIETILKLYPSDPAAGSPFGTGKLNAFTPEYKRIAAIEGDFFHAGRRHLLERLSSTQAAYNFLSARKFVPGLGVAHGTDLFDAFGPGDMTDYFIRFVRRLDPNGRSGVQWPRYDTSSRKTLQFNDGSTPVNVTADTERLAGTSALFDLGLRFTWQDN
ncbi:carotenoid ester lipase precursor [Cerioporus squamosus]|nr:carotenoid ester lipase precursor [Cerioporus squamosus]